MPPSGPSALDRSSSLAPLRLLLSPPPPTHQTMTTNCTMCAVCCTCIIQPTVCVCVCVTVIRVGAITAPTECCVRRSAVSARGCIEVHPCTLHAGVYSGIRVSRQSAICMRNAALDRVALSLLGEYNAARSVFSENFIFPPGDNGVDSERVVPLASLDALVL